MKIVARSVIGKEFLFTYVGAFFAPDKSAQKMADLMNKNNYRLKPGETWYVHDRQYDDTYRIEMKLFFYRGQLKAKYI